MLNPIHFRQLDKLWGPHSVDRNSFQLPEFCPGGALGPKLLMLLLAVGGGENNWLKLGNEQGTLMAICSLMAVAVSKPSGFQPFCC